MGDICMTTFKTRQRKKEGEKNVSKKQPENLYNFKTSSRSERTKI